MAGVSSRFSTRRDINELHVKDFPGYSSVVGADNTVPFQAAINEAINGVTVTGHPAGRTVVLPPGRTYIDPTTITYTSAQLPFNLRGAGDYPSSSGSWLVKNPGSGTGTLLKIDGSGGGSYQWGCEIRDIFFIDLTAQGGDGLMLKHTTFVNVERCAFQGFVNGLRLTDAFTNRIVHCKGYGCSNACYYLESAANLNVFETCGAFASAYGAYVASGHSNSFCDFDSENNTTSGFTMAASSTDVSVRGGQFESNAVQAQVTDGRLRMEGVFFVQSGGTLTLAAGTTGIFDFCRGYTAQTVSGAGTKTLTNCVNVT